MRIPTVGGAGDLTGRRSTTGRHTPMAPRISARAVVTVTAETISSDGYLGADSLGRYDAAMTIVNTRPLEQGL
jgi:hypothetical protein